VFEAFDVTSAVLTAASAGLSVSLALLFLTKVSTKVTKGDSINQASDGAATVFLFDDGLLLDTNCVDTNLLSSPDTRITDLDHFVGLLSPRFPDLRDRISEIDDLGRQRFQSVEDMSVLTAEPVMGLLRFQLQDGEIEDPQTKLNAQRIEAMEEELNTLRATTENGPFLAWRQRADGTITWANHAYQDLVQLVDNGTAEAWPPRHVFDLTLLQQAHESRASRRLALKVGENDRQRWFECYSAKVGSEILFSAIDVDATVLAETQLREFMQTLTKTFAHLTIGLAIFDRARRLALFNPALTDLTSLPVDFLTGRPTLIGFLDRLRERQMVPEPKDYSSWRRQMADLEAAATDGTFAETWSLPNGQTYRVTGRPHPDGAVAFLFEDISAEMSLTRRFKSELEMGQAVLDSMQDAVAVFSSNGVLSLSNEAYSDLWGTDPSASLNDIGIVDATRTWMARSAPTPLWGELRDFVGQTQNRDEWSADLRLSDGRGLTCNVIPLSAGATLVRFAEGRTKQSADEVQSKRA
jgi:PAS domain-containing protein